MKINLGNKSNIKLTYLKNHNWAHLAWQSYFSVHFSTLHVQKPTPTQFCEKQGLLLYAQEPGDSVRNTCNKQSLVVASAISGEQQSYNIQRVEMTPSKKQKTCFFSGDWLYFSSFRGFFLLFFLQFSLWSSLLTLPFLFRPTFQPISLQTVIPKTTGAPSKVSYPESAHIRTITQAVSACM